MKRLFLTILLVSFSGFSSDILAYDTCNPANPFVPCTYNSVDFDSYIGNDNQGAVFFIYSAMTGLTEFPEYYYVNVSNGSSLINFGYSSAWIDYGFYNGGMAYKSPFYGITGFQMLGGVTPVSMILNITRNPELGGGVIVTPPPGFPDFHCGVNSEEECEFETNLNDQVTLEAEANTGYAFSHWEINSQTMGDVDGTITIAMSEDKDVKAVFKPVLNFPLSGTLGSRTILSHFGDDWLTHCDGLVKIHTGVDIQATQDETVSATGTGEIKLIFEDTSEYQWGWCVVIEHDGVYTTTYWHLNDPRDSEIYVGATVMKGQAIGTVKNMSTNTHLHFGVRMHAYTSDNVPNAGALPQTPDCGGYPDYPEFFLNPENLTYE